MSDFAPTSCFTNALLTDKYQLSMAYAYFKNGTHCCSAVFDLYFRKNPFHGEFTVFAGLEECLRFIANFRFNDDELAFVRSLYPHADKAFFDWLSKVCVLVCWLFVRVCFLFGVCLFMFHSLFSQVDSSGVAVYACDEGSLVFPNVPLLRIEGPLAVCQLLETTLLVLVNFASLVATNAARHCIAAGPRSSVVEFGLRRAQA